MAAILPIENIPIKKLRAHNAVKISSEMKGMPDIDRAISTEIWVALNPAVAVVAVVPPVPVKLLNLLLPLIVLNLQYLL